MLSSNKCKVQVYTEIKSISFAALQRLKLLEENIRSENILCSIVDLSTIASIFHLEVGVVHAIKHTSAKNRKTKSFYDEVMYFLSTSNKINDAYEQFKVGINTKSFAIIEIVESDNITSHDYSNSVFQANLQSFLVDMEANPDINAQYIATESYFAAPLSEEKYKHIMKLNKLTQPEIDCCIGLDNAIATRIATKEFIN